MLIQKHLRRKQQQFSRANYALYLCYIPKISYRKYKCKSHNEKQKHSKNHSQSNFDVQPLVFFYMAIRTFFTTISGDIVISIFQGEQQREEYSSVRSGIK